MVYDYSVKVNDAEENAEQAALSEIDCHSTASPEAPHQACQCLSWRPDIKTWTGGKGRAASNFSPWLAWIHSKFGTTVEINTGGAAAVSSPYLFVPSWRKWKVSSQNPHGLWDKGGPQAEYYYIAPEISKVGYAVEVIYRIIMIFFE